MADTAFEVISRCRVTSISSNVGGGAGASWAACSQEVSKRECGLLTHARQLPEGTTRMWRIAEAACLC